MVYHVEPLTVNRSGVSNGTPSHVPRVPPPKPLSRATASVRRKTPRFSRQPSHVPRSLPIKLPKWCSCSLFWHDPVKTRNILLYDIIFFSCHRHRFISESENSKPSYNIRPEPRRMRLVKYGIIIFLYCDRNHRHHLWYDNGKLSYSFTLYIEGINEYFQKNRATGQTVTAHEGCVTTFNSKTVKRWKNKKIFIEFT